MSQLKSTPTNDQMVEASNNLDGIMKSLSQFTNSIAPFISHSSPVLPQIQNLVEQILDLEGKWQSVEEETANISRQKNKIRKSTN